MKIPLFIKRSAQSGEVPQIFPNYFKEVKSSSQIKQKSNEKTLKEQPKQNFLSSQLIYRPERSCIKCPKVSTASQNTTDHETFYDELFSFLRTENLKKGNRGRVKIKKKTGPKNERENFLSNSKKLLSEPMFRSLCNEMVAGEKKYYKILDIKHPVEAGDKMNASIDYRNNKKQREDIKIKHCQSLKNFTRDLKNMSLLNDIVKLHTRKSKGILKKKEKDDVISKTLNENLVIPDGGKGKIEVKNKERNSNSDKKPPPIPVKTTKKKKKSSFFCFC